MNRPPTFVSSVRKPTKKEVELWESILKQQGLSMEAGGLGGHRLDYGARYFDAHIPFDYTKPDTNARQKNQNKVRGEQILSLVEQGLSIYAAAKKLGINYKRAKRSVQRYRANFTRPPASGSYEGENDVEM